jgi:hypothetical protein
VKQSHWRLGDACTIHLGARQEREGKEGKEGLLAKVSFLNLIVAYAIVPKHKLRLHPVRGSMRTGQVS